MTKLNGCALHERKFRRQTGWFLAEGARICHEALDLGWVMHRLAFVAGREDDRQVKRLLLVWLVLTARLYL